MNTVADELRDVTAAQGIPAGEHEEWRPRAKGGYPVDQPPSLLGREFSWIAVGERLRATMDAREGTGTSHFPDDDERSSLEGGDLGRGLYCVDRRCLMSDYQFALVFHLFGAFSLVAGTVVAGVAFEAARRRGAPSEIARLLGLTRIGVLFVGAGFVVALAFGLWLVRIAQWGYGSSWIEAAYGLLAASAVLGTVGGQPPKAGAEARCASRGGADADDARAAGLARRPRRAGCRLPLRSGLDRDHRRHGRQAGYLTGRARTLTPPAERQDPHVVPVVPTRGARRRQPTRR